MTAHGNDFAEGSQGEGFGSILVPVDGSPESLAAIEYASNLRADRIVVLRVEVDEPVVEDDTEDAYNQWRREHLGTVTRELEQQVQDHAGAAQTVEYAIRYGIPAEQIIAEAQAHDLVVMSSRGKGAAGRLLFGSVTDRVVRFGTVPTLVIRASRDQLVASTPERIVVPLDGSELAEEALPIARRVARAASLPLHLLRVVGMDEVLQTVRRLRSGPRDIYELGDEPYEVGRQHAEADALAYLEEVRDQLTADGLTATVELLGGTPSFELLEAVSAAELVVMTSRGQGGIQRWMLGSVSEKLMREAKAPVLLVPVGRTGNEGRSEFR